MADWCRVRTGTLSRLLVGAVVLVLMGTLPARAQQSDGASGEATRYTMTFRNVPLDEALQRFAARTQTDLAYATDLVDGRRAYCQIRNASAEALLRCILSDTGLDYLRSSSGTYLLVEAFRAPDALGDVTGTVVDATTGEPLPDANVLLADASTGTSTNRAGRFSFPSLLAGPHRLVVTYVGYTTSVDSVWVPPGGEQRVRVALTPRTLTTKPLVVDGTQQRLPSATLGQNRLSAETLRSPSGFGALDVLRSASRQTGVASSRPQADLHVQGGGTGEYVTRLDGVPVREPVSLGGLLSAFSPKALDRLVVHKSGFEAAQGSYTAGVVDATHDVAQGDGLNGALSADLVSVNGRAELGWNASETGTGHAMMAVRQSVWPAYRAPALHSMLDAWTRLDPTLTTWWLNPSASGGGLAAPRITSHVGFTDVHGAVRQELSPFHELYVSGYHGTNRLSTSLGGLTDGGAPRLVASEGRNSWTNTAVQGRYEWVASARVAGSLQLYGSRHRSQTFFGLRDSVVQSGSSPDPTLPAGSPQTADHAADGNRLSEAGLRLRTDVSAAPWLTLQAGLTPQYFQGRFQVRNRFIGALSHETSAWQVASYAEGEATLGLGTVVTGGVRLTHLPSRQTVYAEPRLSVRLDRAETAVGDVAVRLAGGVYRQYVVQSEISNAGPAAVVPSTQFWLPLDGSLAPPRAYHAAGDVLLAPSEVWTLRLETYYKAQPRTLEVDYARLVLPTPLADARTAIEQTAGRLSDLMVAGEGRAYGAALRVQRDGSRLSGDATVEVGRVWRRYPGRFDDRFVPAPWEEPLRLTANLDVRLFDEVYAQGSWQGGWGRSWALRRAYYDYVAPLETNGDASSAGPTVGGYDLSRPGQQRLAPFSRFDLGLRATLPVRGTAVETRVEVINVLDRHNPFDWGLDTSGPEVQRLERTLPGRRLSLSVGVRF